MTRRIFKRVITRDGDVLDDLIWQHYDAAMCCPPCLRSIPLWRSCPRSLPLAW